MEQQTIVEEKKLQNNHKHFSNLFITDKAGRRQFGETNLAGDNSTGQIRRQANLARK